MEQPSTINSSTNKKIKLLRKLSNKKYRDESGLFFIENLKTISDAQKAGYKYQELFVTSELLKKNNLFVKDLLYLDAPCFIINEQINNSLSCLDTPSGICAIYKKQEKPLDLTKPIIYLNSINDPGNLGTILRTSLAFGYNNIVFDEQCADLYNSKTLNASKDAIFKLNIESDNELGLLKKIKEHMPIFSTRMLNSTDVKQLKPPPQYCLVFGNEARGVSDDIVHLSAQFVSIKMSTDMESLNVAVAVGIILHSLVL